MRVINKISIGDAEYKIIYDNNYKHTYYPPLIQALVKRITKAQMQRVFVKLNKDYIILHQELVNCFRQLPKTDVNDDENEHCICGMQIFYLHTIENNETFEKYLIGSECINHWSDEKKIKNQNEITRCKREGKEIPVYCNFCFIKKPKKMDCISCPKKIEFLTITKTIFDSWKKITIHSYVEKYLKNESKNKNLIKKYLGYIKMEKTFVDVSYKSKELAKPYVNYDADEKRFYLKNNKDIDKFIKVYLKVKYDDKEDVKASGGFWDPEVKLWYTYAYDTKLVDKYST
jgi:hypothetical protein